MSPRFRQLKHAEVAKRTFRLGNNAWAKPPSGPLRPARNSSRPQGLSTARWNQGFADALYRLLQLDENPVDLSILGKSRLHEFYYELLKGEAGHSFRNAFGVGNEIARSIEFLSSNLDKTVTIEDLADQAGMSRAVFHRKFKQATNMSPIQFLKSMRLNKAAMKIAEGQNVSVAAMDVGYLSSSQFSREFKRLYGLSPKQWSQTEKAS
ncbi:MULTISPECIES: AraC family transcriptional regulator [Marinobacter]|uniref:AraC-like DNA-binding protein n=1 Tax=Marinobacter persicus TaxID=930118 RepID=A0A2S6G225_9GAMM|nr:MULTISPECIES: AraC family transcriptional regulator [Marinobacter]PPK48878.1 AraC-like DNA-binding protein [Marinobacter persicus]PPK50495.1 AraC-like DNA-binding protein [Marinobacter persicus]PPK54731.1 AraC-like DNA-binding protein [Marinobacter persicus]